MSVVLIGCGDPALESSSIIEHPHIPANASNVHLWYADTPLMSTYFGRATVNIKARAWLGATKKNDVDIIWEVQAVSDNGSVLGYLGQLSTYMDEFGEKRSEVVPAFNADELDTGLYIYIENKLEFDLDTGELLHIRPVAHIREIRDHVIKPFDYPMPLQPRQATDLTPQPDMIQPELKSRGTPMPGLPDPD